MLEAVQLYSYFFHCVVSGPKLVELPANPEPKYVEYPNDLPVPRLSEIFNHTLTVTVSPWVTGVLTPYAIPSATPSGLYACNLIAFVPCLLPSFGTISLINPEFGR